MEDNQWITIKRQDNETLIKVYGDYELIGFFPAGNGSNMAIVLKETKKEDSTNEWKQKAI